MLKWHIGFLVLLFNACVAEQQQVLQKEQANIEPVMLARVVLSPQKGSVKYPFSGISGFDYVAKDQQFYAITDDKGKYGPIRFYRLSLDKEHQISNIEETVLTDNTGVLLGQKEFDAEAIRYHPDNKIVWSSEMGQVYVTDLATLKTSEFLLPDYIKPSSGDIGARKNRFIEGISFTADFKYIMFALEGPLKQDGQNPGLDKGSLNRILLYEFVSQKLLAEYLYPVDAIPKKSTAIPALQDNGISDILALDKNTLLILERSGRHVGDFNFAFNNRIFIVNLEKAENIAGSEVVKDIQSRTTAQKKIVVNMENLLPEGQSNIESLTWGPNIKDQQTLYLAVDDNFHAKHDSELIIIALKKDRLLQVFD